MSQSNSVDIVIPSFRLNEAILLPIIHLSQPEGWLFRFYLIVDNPDVAIPAKILEYQRQGNIQLILNKRNEGPAETRNVGIRAGQGKWILFLDDDIVPDRNLLQAYVTAISTHEDAIGFVGVTRFPKPMNAVTQALTINGSVVHFDMALRKDKMVWAPTANIMLNREKLDPALFNAALKNGGEDIEFLARNSFRFGQQYLSVPQAIVSHPWWNDGNIQTERMFRYGKGAADIIDLPAIRKYTYYDFTNTAETLILLLLSLPFFLYWGWFYSWVEALLVLILAEYITNWIKAIKLGKQYAPVVAFYLMWTKNCYECGALFSVITKGKWTFFAKRIDVGFNKENPSSFRTNKWKIIKMILLILLGACIIWL
jgi:glycosyltransferase involved in cell wall biosynthesis